MRFIYCPHGNSNKGKDVKGGPLKDISLVYGRHMQELLLSQEENSQQIVIGNFRLQFYKDHQHFYDKKVEEKLSLAPFDPAKKTLLYAPTWRSQEDAEPFFYQAKNLLESLSSSFNVIVKLHPFLEEWQPGLTHHFISTYTGKEGIYFLDHFPPIYPLLSKCDGYIGDFSSIGYDFLAFDRPIFLTLDEKGPLQSCSLQIPRLSESGLFLEDNWDFNQKELSKNREQTYYYTFEKAQPQKKILDQIKNPNF